MAVALWSIRGALCLALFGIAAAFGQTPTLVMSVDKNPLGVSDQFVLKIVLSHAQGRIERPDLSGFSLVQGPVSSQSTQNINGRVTREFSETYVLRPKRQGLIKILPAKAYISGETLTSNSIDLKVQQGSPKSSETGGDFFARVEVSKKQVFVGEGLTILFKIYSVHENIERIDRADYPDMAGFWTEEYPMDRVNWEPGKQLISGKQYSVAILRKLLVFPQQAGEVKIGSFDISCVARISRSFWDTRKEQYNASSSPISLTVKSLPGERPPHFLGTFDNLSLNVNAEPRRLQTNEAIDLSVKFSGKGNFKTLGDALDLEFPQDFEVYEPTVKDNLALTDGGLNGSRVFQYLAIPRVPGQFAMADIAYSWFDSRAGRFKTLSPGLIEFTVTKGEGGTSGAYSVNPKSDVNILNSDIRYIISDVPCLSVPGKPFFGSNIYYASLAGIPAFGLLMLFLIIRRQNVLSDTAAVRRSGATDKALRLLKKAEKDSDAALPAILRSVLEGYVSDKFGIPPSELDLKRVIERVTEGTDADKGALYGRLLADCQMAGYAGGSAGIELRPMLAQAAELIKSIDRG